MLLYVFSCNKVTNVWAGIGAQMWAVSDADASVNKQRRTRAERIRIGQAGIVYLSESQSFTTPFIFMSQPDVGGEERQVWPERWIMPFSIRPLGSPRLVWSAREALKLPFNSGTKKNNIASAFKVVGTAVFSPIEIGDEDWSILMTKLAA